MEFSNDNCPFTQQLRETYRRQQVRVVISQPSCKVSNVWLTIYRFLFRLKTVSMFTSVREVRKLCFSNKIYCSKLIIALLPLLGKIRRFCGIPFAQSQYFEWKIAKKMITLMYLHREERYFVAVSSKVEAYTY